MDRKGIIVIVASVILLMTWPLIINKLYPPKPVEKTAVVAATNGLPAPSGTNAVETVLTATNPPTPRTISTAATAPEELVVIESTEARYTFTSHGGGLKLVELKDQYKSFSRDQKQRTAETNWVTLNAHAPLPTLALVGSDTIQGDGIFKLTASANSVRAEKVLSNGLAVVKEFQIRSNSLLSATARLENRSGQPIPLPAQEWVVGTATPLGPKDDGSMMGIMWYNGKGAETVQQAYFANSAMGCACLPGTPRSLYVGGQTNVNWVAAHNQFFALAVIPPTNVLASQIITRKLALPLDRIPTDGVAATGKPLPGRAWLFTASDFLDLGAVAARLRGSTDSLAKFLYDQLSADTKEQLGRWDAQGVPESLRNALIADLNRLLQGPSLYHANKDHFLRFPLSEATRGLVDQGIWVEDGVRLNRLVLGEAFARDIKPGPSGYQASLVYPPATLAAGQALERRFLIYAGPREYKTLSRLSEQMQNQVELIMDFGFFGFFAKMLLLSLNGLHATGLDYGSTIIVITIIIKLLFWPLTNMSTRSMKRMAALQPQMKALQEKYKDEPQKMQRKLMEFYKEHKINPASGCLPVLIQMPIFFGFFVMIRTAIELRGARFLWIPDLSQPDTLFMIPGLNMPFNPLPLLMGATMLWQARLTPVSPGADPMQQKLMKYMPLMFLVFLYNFSAGLTLYWTVQNLLSIVQMKLTKTTDDPHAARPAAPSPVTPKALTAKPAGPKKKK